MLLNLALIDSSLARVQTDMLSDQTLLELLISALDEKTQSLHQDSEGAFRNIKTWSSVNMNEDGGVHVFSLRPSAGNSSSGSFVPKYLPRSVKCVRINASHIDGTVDFTDFPPELEILKLDRSRFAGSAALEELSESTRVISISSNRFTGTIAFENLPPCLESLNVANNGLEGTVAFRALPPRISQLDLAVNMFTGDLHADAIPRSIQSLSLFNNDFSGTFEFRLVRPGIIVRFRQTAWLSLPENPLVDRQKYCNRALKII